MNFCESCDNLLVLKLEKNNIKYYCKVCDKFYVINKVVLESRSKVVVDETNNKVITGLYDDTYPRIIINCKNKDCDNNIIIYYRDEKTMKCVYICRKCQTYWRN